MDEFDIEGSNLRTNKSIPHPLAIQDKSVKSEHARHPIRLIRGLLVTCCLVVALTILLITNTAFGSIFRSLESFGAASNNTQERVWVADTVPWGKLYIDNRLYRSINDGSELVLATGIHQLRYVAPPFAPLGCVFHVPLSRTDTCPHFDGDASIEYPAVPLPSQMLDLGATLTALSADQQTALLQAMQRVLDAAVVNISVLPNEHVVGTHGQAVAVSSGTAIKLSYHLRAQSEAPMGQGSPTQECLELCVVPSQQGQSWRLSVSIWLEWQYMLVGSGHVNYDSPTTQDVQVEFLIGWKDGWNAMLKDGTDAALSTAMCSLQQIQIASLRESLPPSLSDLSSTYVPSARSVGSCLTVITLQNSASQTMEEASLLYCNGVLLAVDHLAHNIFPQLPIAAYHEQALAAQLLKGTSVGQ